MTSVRQVADIMQEITAASAEQSAGIEQANQAVLQMDQVTQQNAAPWKRRGGRRIAARPGPDPDGTGGRVPSACPGARLAVPASSNVTAAAPPSAGRQAGRAAPGLKAV